MVIQSRIILPPLIGSDIFEKYLQDFPGAQAPQEYWISNFGANP